VVEGARLESVYRGNPIAGSNPALSAKKWLMGPRQKIGESVYKGNPALSAAVRESIGNTMDYIEKPSDYSYPKAFYLF